MASQRSQHVGWNFSSMLNYTKPHHGCFARVCAQRCVIAAFNPFAAQRCVLQRQGFSSCEVVAGVIQKSSTKIYQQCLKDWVSWCAQDSVPINSISTPK